MPFTPDAANQDVSSISYGKQSNVVTPTVLPLIATYNRNYAGSVKRSEVDYSLGFNPNAIAKKSTFTLAVASPAAADTVSMTVTDGSATPKVKKYTYDIQAGDTEAEIALGLAAFANTNPFVSVTADITASPAVFTVTGVIPGQDYTLAITKVGTSPILSAITVVNPASGTPALGQIFSVYIDVTVSNDGYLQFQPTVVSFNGAVTPEVLSTIPLAPYKHQLSLAALQLSRGY
jgi:hypothetical protein